MIFTGNVYIASVDENSNWCKIGFTRKRPEHRIEELKRCYKGYNFSYFWHEEVVDPSQRESMYKRFFADRCIYGEMFSVSPKEALDAVRYIGGRNFFVPGIGDAARLCSFNPSIEQYKDQFFHTCMANKGRFIQVAKRYFDVFNVKKMNDIEFDHFGEFVMEHML